LFDFLWQFTWMGAAAIEHRDLMAATQRIVNLLWAGETCSPED
jgi:hypothetical protein